MNVIFPEKLMNLEPMWWGKEIGEGITSRMDILLSQLFLPPRSGNIIFLPLSLQYTNCKYDRESKNRDRNFEAFFFAQLSSGSLALLRNLRRYHIN